MMSEPVVSRPRRSRASISLTPLIDVVFILLVFFMLASRFHHWRAIHLGITHSGAGIGGMEGKALLLKVGRDRLYLDGEVVSLEQLGIRTQQGLRGVSAKVVVVQPLADVPLQRVVDVLDRLTAAGASQVSLVADGNRDQ